MLRSEFDDAVTDALTAYWPKHDPAPGILDEVHRNVIGCPVSAFIAAIQGFARDNPDEMRPSWSAIQVRCHNLTPRLIAPETETRPRVDPWRPTGKSTDRFVARTLNALRAENGLPPVNYALTEVDATVQHHHKPKAGP
jgi:hypothetical protein